MYRNRLFLRCLTGLALALFAMVPVAEAQQFVTQSGGRGLVNAKTNARLTKAEKDVGDLQDEMAKVKPHAKAEISQCVDTGAKVRWDGQRWTCDSETDPTVQGWAKEALPSCQPGSLLGVSGGQFSCTTSGFVSDEIDPTVQTFAKNPLPMCGGGQVLGVSSDGNLMCVADEQGLSAEVDPNVYDFARKDKVAIANCTTGQVSKMENGRLVCVFDMTGITVEEDPLVQDFARNDIDGIAELEACATGEILTSVDSGGTVILQCTAGGTALNGALSLANLSDVQLAGALNDEVLRFNGSKWVNSDDKIGTLTNGSICTTNGSEIRCTQSAPTTCGAGEFLSWDGSGWSCDDASSAIAPAIMLDDLGDVTVTTPATGHVLVWNGSGWVNQEKYNITYGDSSVLVTDAGTGMVQLVPDGVAILTATGGQVGIRTNNPDFDLDVNGNAGIGSTLTVAGDTSISGMLYANGGLTLAGSLNLADALITSLTAVNASVTNNLDVAGRASLTHAIVNNDLTVYGNLNVSGTQTIDGVIFANGGVQMAGTLSAVSITANEGTIVSLTAQDVSVTRNLTVAGGLSAAAIGVTNMNAGNVTMSSATITGDGRVNGDFYVDGSLYVSGSQTIDGVIFANGGMTASDVSANQATIVSLTAQDVSVTQNLTVAGVAAMGSGVVTNDLTVYGNLNVSGTQTFDGVTFANGGVSASGVVTATAFSGDGSGLTGVAASSVAWVSVTSKPVSLTDMIALAPDDSAFIVGDGTTWVAETGATVRTSLGLGSMALQDASSVDITGGLLAGIVGISATNVSVSNIITADGAQFTTLGAGSAGLGNLAASNVSVTGDAGVMGNVGIGTYAPDHKLHVVGNGLFTGDLTVHGNLNVSGSQVIDGVMFANGGVSATGVVTATAFSGDGSGLTNLSLDALALNEGVSGSLVFRDGNGLLRARSTLLVSSTTGTVGIGAAAPGWLGDNGLYVVGGIRAAAVSIDDDTAFGWGDGSVNILGDSSTDYLRFRTNSNEHMRIIANGNVGIGTAVPNARLEVAGEISATDLRLSGNLYVSGSQIIDGVMFANGGVSATGVVTATAFVGDGGGLTGIGTASIEGAGHGGSIQFKGVAGDISGTNELVWNNTDKVLGVSGTIRFAGTGAETCNSSNYGMMRYVDTGGGVYRAMLCRP